MKASGNVFFLSLLIQTSFSEGKNRSRQVGEKGREETHVGGTSVHMWVCACDS